MRFTWKGLQWENLDRGFKRLDRAMSNADWRIKYPEEKLEVLARQFSDEVAKWNKEIFKPVTKQKRRIMSRLEGIQRAPNYRCNPFFEKLEKRLNNELEDMLDREELMWKQKVREQWVVEGDRNTKYFHT
ncbi:hypothetical protein Ahy_A05g025541 [Arachis hypogaea]|uniref:Uncharacterized protein n=1 Tax=Arachis hypogaea TaxID=3818 RepID=A0A445D8Y5_ARAHY|nr:hypothetical protein Ahy_A05g025541 [Arachis hypogaea]